MKIKMCESNTLLESTKEVYFLESAVGYDITFKYDGWFENKDLKIKKENHYWNDGAVYEFASIYAKSVEGKRLVEKIKKVFSLRDYRIEDAVYGFGSNKLCGITIYKDIMTPEELRKKAQSGFDSGSDHLRD